MRKYIDIITEAIIDRENDQQYLMSFYNSCMFLANKYRGFAFGAAVFVALAKAGKVDCLEAMFNNELLPFLAARGYPDEGSPEWAEAQNEVMNYFHDKKRGDYDISDLG